MERLCSSTALSSDIQDKDLQFFSYEELSLHAGEDDFQDSIPSLPCNIARYYLSFIY